MKSDRIITGAGYRIMVLTDRLIRLEYRPDGMFEDRLTKTVVNRDFSEDVAVKTLREGNGLTLETDSLILKYDGGPFSTLGLSILLKDTGAAWHYSIVYANSDGNYLGTARTLDLTDGFTELEPGIFGMNGYAVLDDSTSPVLEDGEFINNDVEKKDLYFFGYGKDFYGGLKDFYHLCGQTPMIPRYALGNWWSRYHRYTEDSYRELLDRFEEMGIPLSVAVIDMDWHLTAVDSKYGTGWTGFTWDEECFPDYKRFLAMLKERKLASTLNLHPADGIRAYESMYRQVAEMNGIDPDSGEPVEFNMSDPRFRKSYFEDVLHPYEDAGVDFWWIDWQQGTGKAGAVDPLFLLNHYHYQDQEDRGKRPMIFSRYAGPGSHRYPVGFSGDTRSTWRSLGYQPYFTSTASNIGYGWWSHDIGGHMLGDKDNERLIRWIQFGVFSPVMRIHSSNSPFFNKEPWTLSEPYRGIMAEFMRLRHALVPYLYTESRRAHIKGIPMISPLYYSYSDSPEAFEVPNEYSFGRSLIVSAITEPEDRALRMAAVTSFIPEGRWYDIFTGHIYRSKGIKRKLYRPLTSIPVLLKAGSICPCSLEDRKNGTDNPAALKILFGGGDSGEYTLYEDDGVSMDYRDGKYVTTRISMDWGSLGSCYLNVDAAEGSLEFIPAQRSYSFCIYGIEPDEGFLVSGNGISDKFMDTERHILTISTREIPVNEPVSICISGIKAAENNTKAELMALLDGAWTEMEYKEKILCEYLRTENSGVQAFLQRLSGLNVPETMKDAVRELFD